jgi:hypothetical protein
VPLRKKPIKSVFKFGSKSLIRCLVKQNKIDIYHNENV